MPQLRCTKPKFWAPRAKFFGNYSLFVIIRMRFTELQFSEVSAYASAVTVANPTNMSVNRPNNVSRGLLAVLAFGFAPFAIYAQPVPEDIVVLTVSADAVSPLQGQAKGRHWVLVNLPGAEDVKITDQGVRDLFISKLDVFKTDQQMTCGVPPIVDPYPRTSCSFITGMQFLMSMVSLSFTTAELKRAPPADVPSTAVQIVLRGKYMRQPDPPPMNSLCIVASIGRYPGTCDQNRENATTVLLSTIADRFNLGALPPELGNIEIQTRVAPPGAGAPAAKNDWPAAQATLQLQAVAVTAFVAARFLNAVPPAATPAANADELARRITATYAIEDSGWPAPDVTLGPMTAGSSRYQLTVKNLFMVERSSVILNQGKDLNIDPDSQPKIDKMLTDTSCRIERKLSSLLSGLNGTIPTNDAAWVTARAVQKSSDVTGVVTPTRMQRVANKNYIDCNTKELETQDVTESYRLDMLGSERWNIGSINGTTSVGIQADSHQLLSGNADLTETHVLSRFETTSLHVNGGPEVQTADLALSLETNRDFMNYGFVLDSVFHRDQNQRFGFLAGPKFVQEEFGPKPTFFIELNRTETVHAFSIDLRGELSYQFHHDLIEPPTGYPSFPARGWVNGFAPSLSLLIGYDFAHSAARGKPRRGLGQVFVQTQADLLKARKSAGGDFAFNRYNAHSKAEVFFGPTTPQDFFVRYTRGFSVTSTTTPLFELPELGGDTNIRGIEIGEYVARGIGFDQTEFGINAQSVWNWFRKPDPAPAKTSAKSGKADSIAAQNAATTGADQTPSKNPSLLSSLGIDGIYVAGLYDRAEASAASSAASLFDLRHAYHGLGVKAEIRGLRAANKRANLGFVYAWSAESVLHKKGTFSTSVSIDF